MDNLNTHRNQIVAAMINIHGHRIVFRAPYYPVDGPIEYVFNTIQHGVSLAMYNINTHVIINKYVCNHVGLWHIRTATDGMA